MDVPALYCGVATDVRKVVRRQVRAYIRGVPWLEAIDGPVVDSRDAVGLLYLDGPGMASAPKDPQVYLYMPYLEVCRAVERGVIPRDQLDALRDLALESDWGTAVMLGGLCAQAFTHDKPASWPALVRAALDHWPILDAEGARYASGTKEGHRLWVVAFGLQHSLRGLGAGAYPKGRGIVFEPRTFLAEHGLLDRVLAATDHP